MPPRSFEHWYRGVSVETAARSSTASPWGIRGALVAPVFQGGFVQGVAASGGLRSGGTAKIKRGASFDAISAVGTHSAASPRVASEIEPASATRFGASARVGVEHGLDRFEGDGRAFGGAAEAIATLEPAAAGGLAVGAAAPVDRPTLVYRIYSNGGLGGAIDYGSPVAEVSGLEWTSEPLPAGSSFRFGVRAYDSLWGRQDENLDASVTLVIDAQGRDATRVPRPPVGLRAIDRGGGRVRLEWMTADQSGLEESATLFHLYLGRNVVTDFSSPILVSAIESRGGVIATEVFDLPAGSSHVAIVRAANAFGEGGGALVRFIVDRTPPARVDGLAASAATIGAGASP